MSDGMEDTAKLVQNSNNGWGMDILENLYVCLDKTITTE
jgi:hypothetical protein